MNLDFHRAQYDYELGQRAHLTSAINIPISAATLLFGVLGTLLLRFGFDSSLSSVVFAAAGAISFIFLVASVYFAFRSLVDYKYKKLPSPMALRRYHKELVKWHRLNGSPAGTEDRDFEDYLNDRLSDATHRNSMNNINRGNYVFRSTLAIAVSVVALLFAAAPFLIQGIGAEESPTLIEVVGEVSVNQGED